LLRPRRHVEHPFAAECGQFPRFVVAHATPVLSHLLIVFYWRALVLLRIGDVVDQFLFVCLFFQTIFTCLVVIDVRMLLRANSIVLALVPSSGPYRNLKALVSVGRSFVALLRYLHDSQSAFGLFPGRKSEQSPSAFLISGLSRTGCSIQACWPRSSS